MAKPPSEMVSIDIPKPDIQTLSLVLVGDEIAVPHRWSEKAIKMMEDKRAGKARKKKEPADPQAEYEASLYRFPDGAYGVPATWFKGAAVDACRYTEGITMKAARGVIFVKYDGRAEDGTALVHINGDGPHMRRDMVRIAMGTADIRYRGEFRDWWVSIRVKYNANILTAEQLVNLFSLAGHHVGVGEGRPGAPKNTMDWGLFHVGSEEEIAQLEAGRKDAAE